MGQLHKKARQQLDKKEQKTAKLKNSLYFYTTINCELRKPLDSNRKI